METNKTKTVVASTTAKPLPTVKTSNAPQNEWSKREIGALWKREGKTQKYLAGHITFSDEFGSEKRLDVQIFANKNKEKDNQPDFRVYFNDRAGNKSSAQTQENRQTARSTPLVSTEEEVV